MADEITEKLHEVETLIHKLESSEDGPARDAARHLLRVVMDLHSGALAGLLGLAEAGSGHDQLVETVEQDPQLKSVLLLHGLHPKDLEARLQEALEKVRPALLSHKGNVELVALEEHTVRLRLIGTCNGCPSSMTTFKTLIESAIFDLAPEIERVEVEGVAQA